jgi:hypothetical protein
VYNARNIIESLFPVGYVFYILNKTKATVFGLKCTLGRFAKEIEIEKTLLMSSEEISLYNYSCGNVYKDRF